MTKAYDGLVSVLGFITDLTMLIYNGIRSVLVDELGSISFLGFIFSVLLGMLIIRTLLNFIIRVIENVFMI